MIIIVSENKDVSTNDVIDWLLDGERVIRVNRTDLKIVTVDYESDEIVLNYKNKEIISSRDVTAFWYRRGRVDYASDLSLSCQEELLQDHIYYHLHEEWNEIVRFFSERFRSKKYKILGTYNQEDRKLTQLHNAKEQGLRIPKTIIATDKESLLAFYQQCNGEIITKGINSSPSFTYDTISLEGYTEAISSDLLRSLPQNFFPSLFQENIEKQYELRIFYLKGKFYSMAIFSQTDEQTKTDVRKYNNDKPNRTVPYLLPNSIQIKLNSFMDSMDLDTGSIDMMVDKNNQHYFLEVNPNGQFGMVSVPCNYYIERNIAKELI